MIINLKPYAYHGFMVRDNDYGKALLLSESELEKSAAFVKEHYIQGLEINHIFGYNLPHLDCLKLFPTIKHLRVVNNIADTTGLTSLKELVTLELAGRNNELLDFTKFTYLQSCYMSWNKNRSSIFDCDNLIKLGLEGYKSSNLSSFSKLINLETLGIENSTINSLSGLSDLLKLNSLSLRFLNKLEHLDNLEGLNSLNQLEIYNVNKLTTLRGIEKLIGLTELVLEKCKLIENVQEVGNLVNLRKLVLNNMGKISSLKPVENLDQLEELFFIENTNLIDGDLSPLEKLRSNSLKKFSFQNRRHYSLKREDLGWPDCLRI